jgi:hypothetical protein
MALTVAIWLPQKQVISRYYAFFCVTMSDAQETVFSEGKWPFQSGNADVAQLVEQRFRKPQVTGSNPVVGSILRWHQRGE